MQQPGREALNSRSLAHGRTREERSPMPWGKQTRVGSVLPCPSLVAVAPRHETQGEQEEEPGFGVAARFTVPQLSLVAGLSLSPLPPRSLSLVRGFYSILCLLASKRLGSESQQASLTPP
ncbi:hypothetical protein CDD83_536 [Cordyceps sp. RAO-2017]|nr:hypothetical protein CDD83_536 [Cordyceps sp. RAO-2017]